MGVFMKRGMVGNDPDGVECGYRERFASWIETMADDKALEFISKR